MTTRTRGRVDVEWSYYTFDGVPPPGENGVKQQEAKGAARKTAKAAWNPEPPFPIACDLSLLSQAIAAAVDAASPLGAAKALAGYSVPVFPVSRDGHKKPLNAHGVYSATIDLEEIDRLWKRHPDALVAVPMGRRAGMLAIDADANGLHEPIALTPDNLLLDGRHRALACAVAGIEPTAFTYDGDPWLYSLSKNAHRTHMSRDRVAMVVAELTIMRPVGANQHEGGSDELPSIAMVAEKAGVTQTAIKSANAVLKHGTRDEVEAVKLGRKPLRKTADTARACMRATAPSKPQLKHKSVKTSPAADPIDTVASAIVSVCGDRKWRSLPKIAAAVKFADTAVRQALKRLGDDRVAQRKTGNELEYWIAGKGDADLRRKLAAKDEENARPKKLVAKQNLEIEQLMERLTTPSLAMAH